MVNSRGQALYDQLLLNAPGPEGSKDKTVERCAAASLPFFITTLQ